MPSFSSTIRISTVVHLTLGFQQVKVGPVTDVMIFKKISPKKYGEIMAFFSQTTASFCTTLIITLIIDKIVNFVAENWRKRQKSVIITFTPVTLVRT
jgi:hypothetical protein